MNEAGGLRPLAPSLAHLPPCALTCILSCPPLPTRWVRTQTGEEAEVDEEEEARRGRQVAGGVTGGPAAREVVVVLLEVDLFPASTACSPSAL